MQLDEFNKASQFGHCAPQGSFKGGDELITFSQQRRWGRESFGEPIASAATLSVFARWWSTAESVGAIPYLVVAAARTLLSGLWPLRGCLSPPKMPGVPHSDAAERRVPPQSDWRERETALTLRSCDVPIAEGILSALSHLPRTQPSANSNAAWLSQKPYRLVLGSGFIGIYQHIGRIRALDKLGLVPREVVGYSSGAIAGAMVCCLGVSAAQRAMVELQVADFLDPSFAAAWGLGGACTGKRLQAKFEHTLAPGGTDRIEALEPIFQVAVYDREASTTTLFRRGPLALRVRQSAALPILFALGRYIDGGWMDHHGRLAMLPGERTLQSRLPAGNGGSLATAIGRTDAIFSISEDPEHATLSVLPAYAVRLSNFIFIIDHDKSALRRIIEEAERPTLAWL